jgi:hypothetical protein
MIALHNK